jgi:hypothetical protein
LSFWGLASAGAIEYDVRLTFVFRWLNQITITVTDEQLEATSH